MTKVGVHYNERSWGADLIGYLKQLAVAQHRSVQDASGELSLRAVGQTLFPDVLLYGDVDASVYLQGWELKFPDTPIDDPEFFDNAALKAHYLGLNSFILWNVTFARIYVWDAVLATWRLQREWDDLANITTRGQVQQSRRRWEATARDILGYVNDLFDRGAIEGRQLIQQYQSGGVTDLILTNTPTVARAVFEAIQRDSTLRASVVSWWARHAREYAEGDRDTILARVILTNWVSKILLAHLLRETDQRAAIIDQLNSEIGVTPREALNLFRALSQQVNFWTVFSNSLGLDLIPPITWSHLKAFNRLLSDLRVASVDQEQLALLLESTVEVATRKLRGQFPTPMPLARLLVELAVRNTVDDRFIDPCCGSGTISRAALEQKLSAGVTPTRAAETIYATDIDPQAVQLATFALASTQLMHLPIRVAPLDVTTIAPDVQMTFQDPSDGRRILEPLGTFQAVASNFPFIAQEGRPEYRDAIKQIRGQLRRDGLTLSGRADVAAYLPFALLPIIADGGRLVFVITNAWLGTEWGDQFAFALERYFRVRAVITSGAGRWFANSDIITNVIVLEKLGEAQDSTHETHFVTLTMPLTELTTDDHLALVAAQVELGQEQTDSMTIRSVSSERLRDFRRYGLGGNAQFSDCEWALELPLVSLSSVSKVTRGERRGFNALFYPAPNHGIEPQYIRPLVKSSTKISSLVADATSEAFCCSASLAELHERGHVGALAWIRRFDTPANRKKYGGPKRHWYEMDAEAAAQIAIPINYGARLFVPRVTSGAMVDQRLITINGIAEADLMITHALLNSSIGLFLLEGLGFPRGLGALDFSATRVRRHLHLLDPHRIDDEGRRAIIKAFAPLLDRGVLLVADELDREDRRVFDLVVRNVFGLSVNLDRVYAALRTLVSIRLAAGAPVPG